LLRLLSYSFLITPLKIFIIKYDVFKTQDTIKTSKKNKITGCVSMGLWSFIIKLFKNKKVS
jgi:hypothetical protein